LKDVFARIDEAHGSQLFSAIYTASIPRMKRAKFILVLTAICAISSFAAPQTSADPYASLSAEQKAILKPGVERYVHDQLKQNWGDLWEIQDQTSDLKNSLLLGNRDAPDMTKDQFVRAMKYTIESGGRPRMRSFELRVLREDKGNLIVIGCAEATRESWHGTGFVIFGARIVDGKAKFDIWSMTSDSCSDRN
jgi:hypothetical protein